MTTTENRAQAPEAKRVDDKECGLLAGARRETLLARRVADQLGLDINTRNDLTTTLVALADGPDHDDRLTDHVVGVFLKNGIIVQRTTIAIWLQDSAGSVTEQLLPA